MQEYRKIHILKTWSAVLIAFLCMAALSFPVFAADTVTVVIPVFVETGVTQENYTFRLTAFDDAPMPESDTIVITGAGSGRFVIEYSSVGVYRYTITQEIPEKGNGTYDTTVYDVTVTIQDTESGFGTTVIAHKEGEEGGKSEIIYDNTPGSVPKETDETDTTEGTEEPQDTETPPETEETEFPEETESAEPTESTKTTDADHPQTGDAAPIGFWLMMMAGICVVAGSFWTGRMKQVHRSKSN